MHVGARWLYQYSRRHSSKLLVREAQAGHQVVRLKGGDVSLFGRARRKLRCWKPRVLSSKSSPGVTGGLAAAATVKAR